MQINHYEENLYAECIYAELCRTAIMQNGHCREKQFVNVCAVVFTILFSEPNIKKHYSKFSNFISSILNYQIFN